MLIDRRAFIVTAAASVAAGQFDPAMGRGSRPKAIAFDGFPIIDPRPVAARAEELFPGKGESLMNAWRTRQFEYTWLRTLSGNYADFWQTTQDALAFAAGSLGLALSGDARDRLMHTYLELKAWPDVAPALEQFRAAGIRLAFLSNFTAAMLDAAVSNAGLKSYFDPHLSTDRVRAYKPDPRAYQMALDAWKLSREEVVFCAAAGWDAAGAKWFGYRTFWLNRSHAPVEALGVQPDGMGAGMSDLVKFVTDA